MLYRPLRMPALSYAVILSGRGMHDACQRFDSSTAFSLHKETTMPYASLHDRAERDHERYAKTHKTLSEAWLVACDLEDENDDGKADLLQAGWYTPDGRFHIKSLRNESGISYREAASFQSDIYYACATMQRKLDASKQ